MKKQVDPDIFITYLEGLRATMRDMESFITDKQFIMHVMNNLNKDYDNTVENLEKLINGKKDPLTIEQMREDLSLKHERLYGTDNAGAFDRDDDGEHALYAGAGRWKGKCNKCGKQGHKGVDCRSNSSSGKGKGLVMELAQVVNVSKESATNVRRQDCVPVIVSRRKEIKAVSKLTPKTKPRKKKKLQM